MIFGFRLSGVPEVIKLPKILLKPCTMQGFFFKAILCVKFKCILYLWN